jgi:epoxide hydrolase-like predicted phosphatase
MNNPSRLIIFDVGGVLYTLDYERTWESISAVCEKPIEAIKNVLYEENTFVPFEKGTLSTVQYYTAVCHRLCCRLGFDEFKKAFNLFLIKRPEMFRLLARLKQKARIHFLSNTNTINAEVLHSSLLAISDGITYSFETGYRKPEPEIYRIALHREKTSPGDTIFIDDSEENVDTAAALGMHTHLFTDIHQLLLFMKKRGIVLS